MSRIATNEGELYSYFKIHLGPRFEAAGLRIQFHYNQPPGIHFKVMPSEGFRAPILKGLQEGLMSRFPEFPSNGSIWVVEVTEHEVDSSQRAFYRVARMVMDQAFSLVQSLEAWQNSIQPGGWQ